MRFKKGYKAVLYGSIIIVVMSIVVAHMVFFHRNDYSVEPFHLNDYKTEVHRFRVDYCVEKIDSARSAAESAIGVWKKEYGYIAENYRKPQVYYDSSAECWLVTGSPPKEEFKEGYAYVYYIPIVLIQADGTVLATWLE